MGHTERHSVLFENTPLNLVITFSVWLANSIQHAVIECLRCAGPRTQSVGDTFCPPAAPDREEKKDAPINNVNKDEAGKNGNRRASKVLREQERWGEINVNIRRTFSAAEGINVTPCFSPTTSEEKNAIKTSLLRR